MANELNFLAGASNSRPSISRDLYDGQVRLWTCALDGPSPGLLSELAGLLAPDERERAERFRFAIHRGRYVAGRAALRTLIGAHLGIAPSTVGFVYGANGKPALHPDHAPAGLTFNLAHCEGFALIAFAHRRELGVDVEDTTRAMDYEAVAARAFSQEERAQLPRLSGCERARWFFRCWTLREAYLKGTGTGLAIDPDDFSVRDVGDRRSIVVDRQGSRMEDWQVRTVDLPEPLAAAIAVRGNVDRCIVSTFAWVERAHDALQLESGSRVQV
jgi:4'-phosphopantetheinyl transferase